MNVQDTIPLIYEPIQDSTGNEDRGAHDTALLQAQGRQQDTLQGVLGPAGIFSPEA